MGNTQSGLSGDLFVQGYLPLNKDNHEIRILLLRKSSDFTSPLTGSIYTIPVDEVGSYPGGIVAFSYVCKFSQMIVTNCAISCFRLRIPKLDRTELVGEAQKGR